MASKGSSSGASSKKTVLRFQGLTPGEERPEVVVRALDRSGATVASANVDKDGSFALPANALKKAHRVQVGPAEAEASSDETALVYRVSDFEKVLEAGHLVVGKGVWPGWFFRWRCVSGRVSRCTRSPWWFEALARETRRPLWTATGAFRKQTAGLGSASALRVAAKTPGRFDLDELIAWPVRCTPICIGKVEVYRRVCCCKPWVIRDPRLDQLIAELEDLIRGIPEIPDGPVPPGPGPYASIQKAVLREGALDERTVRASQDLHALRTLPAERVAEYVNARPYLICRRYECGPAVKVAEGTINPDGRFNICWSEFPVSYRPGCHPKYAYKVKQKLGFFWFTIYNGLTSGQWFDIDDEAHLKSFSPFAVACRDNGGPGDAFVYLDVIGDTGSELLATPDAKSATAVQAPVANSGTAFPTGGPAGAGAHDRNWGGTLKLSIMFSESLKDINAKYYRLSVTEADADGNPVSPREYYSEGLSWTKAVSTGGGGVDVVPVSLGPNSVATGNPAHPQQNHLYEIPFDASLGGLENWEADQYHVYLRTTDPAKQWSQRDGLKGQPAKRHLVTIEIFDDNGTRLRPNGTVATGLDVGPEAEAAFTFRRKFQETGPTQMVPHGALTHLFWWDNRPVEAKIEDLRMNGILSNEECQFLTGTDTSTFGIGYRAYHPWELFQEGHKVWWKRGLSGGSDVMYEGANNVGMEPAPPGASPTHMFGHMLTHVNPPATAPSPPLTKCAFSVFLTTWNKRTDGDNLSFDHDHDSAAFALDVGPGCPPCDCQDGGGDQGGGGQGGDRG